MKKGNLVLYKNQPALITDVQGDKFEITMEAGTKKVREKDIVPLHDGECRSIKAAIDAEVPVADFGEAADFFEGETPSFAELAELLWGTYTAEQSWKLWQALCSSPYFICTSPAEPIGIRTQAEIERLNQKQAEREQAEKLRQDFTAALRACMQGKPFTESKETYRPFFQELEALALGSSSASKILKDAKIIIMDEASAAVDPDNEYELQQAFSNLIKDKTVIMIAHRLPSIRNVDEILVMEDGKIIERGTDSQLMSVDSKYRKFQNLYSVANEWRVNYEK